MQGFRCRRGEWWWQVRLHGQTGARTGLMLVSGRLFARHEFNSSLPNRNKLRDCGKTPSIMSPNRGAATERKQDGNGDLHFAISSLLD